MIKLVLLMIRDTIGLIPEKSLRNLSRNKRELKEKLCCDLARELKRKGSNVLKISMTMENSSSVLSNKQI